MTAILGISAFYHDAAAALVVDGRLVAAAQEERFTRAFRSRRSTPACGRPASGRTSSITSRSTKSRS